MKNKNWMTGVGVLVGVLILTGLSVFLNPWGVLDGIRGRARTAATQGTRPDTGQQGHGGQTPIAAPPAVEHPTGGKPAAEVPTVEIPTDKQPIIGMKSVVVSQHPLRRTIRTVGRVEYDERRFRTVNTKIEGWIERLYVDYTGRPVKKGEPLADLYSPELLATQREFLQLLKWSREAKPDAPSVTDQMVSRDAVALFAAARERLRLWDISEEQIQRIEQTGEPVRTLTIYSPVDGHVVQKMAVQGMRVMAGEKLFDVADVASLWVVADIYEADLPLIRPGQEALIALSAQPGRAYRSRVDFINPSLAGETRTAKARFTIADPGEMLKPQMFTDVEIRVDLGRKLAIPDDAVIDTGVRQVVYVDKGDGNFEPREVALGARTEGFREVLRGLKAGEKIAASATFLVDSEAQLRGVKPLAGPK